VHRLRTRARHIEHAEPSVFPLEFPAQRGAKQLLPSEGCVDIVQKYRASRFALTTGRGGQWEPSDKGETDMSDMTDVILSNPSEMRELTIDELDTAGGGVLLQLFLIGFAIGWAISS
jgi:hypothetical protein